MGRFLSGFKILYALLCCSQHIILSLFSANCHFAPAMLTQGIAILFWLITLGQALKLQLSGRKPDALDIKLRTPSNYITQCYESSSSQLLSLPLLLLYPLLLTDMRLVSCRNATPTSCGQLWPHPGHLSAPLWLQTPWLMRMTSKPWICHHPRTPITSSQLLISTLLRAATAGHHQQTMRKDEGGGGGGCAGVCI